VEARERLTEVVNADPAHAAAFNNLGIVSQHALETGSAIDYYHQAIAIRHDFPDAHFNLGMALLQNGDFESGFAESEWRWKTPRFTPFECPLPLWDGNDISGKTILVHTEQGMGDAMQFIRYLPLVAERCRHTIVVCPPDVMPLFQGVAGIGEIRGTGTQALDSFDVYVLLLSLPHVLKTRIDSVPANVPYLEAPGERDALSWRTGEGADSVAVFNEAVDEFRVGFAWAGSPTHNDDRNRSCALADFFDLLRTPTIAFYSLQKQVSAVDRAQLAALGVRDLSPHLKDFGDMAAAMDQLDLVTSVDTSVVHLAGALAIPVWTLLSYCPDWRWMLEREDSPWYPTMRLFRQQQAKEWSPFFSLVAGALEELRLRRQR
jgi:hypothetical protein